MEGVVMRPLEDLPEGCPLETPLIPPSKRMRRWAPSTIPSIAGQWDDLVVTPAPSTSRAEHAAAVTPPAVTPPDRRAPIPYSECGGSWSGPVPRIGGRLNPRALDYVNYGSDPESDDADGDDDGMNVDYSFRPPGFNRVDMELWFETTRDDEPVPQPPENLQGAGLEPGVDAGLEDGNAYQLNPTNMYDFDWRAFPELPIPAESRRENFTSECGPTVDATDPYEIFILMWDRSFMERIASETNRYAQESALQEMNDNTLTPRSRITEWRNTNVDELYCYMAVVLAMGVVVKSKLEEYWSRSHDIFETPGFRACMSLRRFQLLNRCLHFSNNADMHGRNLGPSEAKLFKVEPVISHLNEKFSLLYNMSQNISLDESLLLWSGWLAIAQVIPNKKAGRGIKIFAMCESETGYLWRFKIHAFNELPPAAVTQTDPVAAYTPSLVLKLVQGLENKGHTLWMDNYYNSPALARKLKTLGFDCAGTLRTNRQFVPAELNKITKGNMRPGYSVGYTSGDVDLLVWRDQNRVAMISTYHGNAVSRDGSGNIKPILVRDYNICMGGVDKKDQMLAMYPAERRRTKVWYKKLFRHLLNVSVFNSYVIHRKSTTPGPKKAHREFRLSLIKSLLQNHAVPSASRPAPIPIPLPNSPAVVNPNIAEVISVHYLSEYPLCPGGNRPYRIRRQCAVCSQRTSQYCVGCNKAVCMKCFRELHVRPLI